MKKACNKQQSDEICDRSSDHQNTRHQNIPLDETQPLHQRANVYSTPGMAGQQNTRPVTVVQPSAPAEDQSLRFSHHELPPPSYEAACAKD